MIKAVSWRTTLFISHRKTLKISTWEQFCKDILEKGKKFQDPKGGHSIVSVFHVFNKLCEIKNIIG